MFTLVHTLLTHLGQTQSGHEVGIIDYTGDGDATLDNRVPGYSFHHWKLQ